MVLSLLIKGAQQIVALYGAESTTKASAIPPSSLNDKWHIP